MFKRNAFSKAQELKPDTRVVGRKLYPSITLPHSKISWTPSVPCEYMHADYYGVHIGRNNLEWFLEDTKPEYFLQSLSECCRVSRELHEGTSVWFKPNWLSTPLYRYLVKKGIWYPSDKELKIDAAKIERYIGDTSEIKGKEVVPWNNGGDDDDLTIVVRDPLNGDVVIGLNHYISIEKHERLMRESQVDIYNIVREQVERGVSAGVEKAVTQQVKTLEQVQNERKRMETQLAEIKATEARMIEAERRQQEREETKRQQQAEREAKRSQTNRAGFVYVARGEYAGDVAYKIGRTINPNSRAKTFGVELPFSVEFIAVFQTPDMYQLERDLHNRYTEQGKWLSGEWFALAADDIAWIKAIAAGNTDDSQNA